MINFIMKNFFNKKVNKKKPLAVIRREANDECIAKVISKARPQRVTFTSIDKRSTLYNNVELKKTVLSKHFVGLEGLSSKAN